MVIFIIHYISLNCHFLFLFGFNWINLLISTIRRWFIVKFASGGNVEQPIDLFLVFSVVFVHRHQCPPCIPFIVHFKFTALISSHSPFSLSLSLCILPSRFFIYICIQLNRINSFDKSINNFQYFPWHHQKAAETEEVKTEATGHSTPHPSDVLDMPVDPNEPTYCLCHQVSYGEMIGCDNPDVSVHNFLSILVPNKIYIFPFSCI